jgi:glutamyl-tRNA reductase
MAMPRNVEPSAGTLAGAFLYDLDGLEAVVEANRAARRQEAAAAERLVQREAHAFGKDLAALDVAPLLAELHRRGEEIRRQELRRVRVRMGALTPEQEDALETLGSSLVEKLLRAPTKSLAARARAGGLGDEAALVRDLLGLS